MNIKKKKIDLTADSLQELMQETYLEIVDQRNRALSAYKKFTKDINENNDIALVGKVTNDLLKIMDSSNEKKLRIIKMQIDVMLKQGKTQDNIGDAKLTEEDKKWFEEMNKKPLSIDDDINFKEYDA